MKQASDVAISAWVRMSMAANDFMERHSAPIPGAASLEGEEGKGADESEEGSTTVEYAIGAIATAAFAGLLLAVLKSGGVKSMLNNIIQTALSV